MSRSGQKLLAVAGAWMLAGANAPQPQPQPQPLQLRDLRAIVRYADAQLSPDGRFVAAVETRADYGKNVPLPQLVLVDVVTHAKRVLTQQRAVVASPRWSPGGDRLAFVSLDEKKKPQVFVLPMNGGEAVRATAAAEGVHAFTFSPDGRRIAYVTADAAPNKKALDAHDDGFVVTQQPSTARGAVVASHIWLVGSDGTSARRLTGGNWSVAPFSRLDWRADSGAIAFTWNTDGSFNFFGRTRAADVDARSGNVHFFGPLGTADPVFDAGGRTVAYLAPNRVAALQNDLVIADADGRHPVDVGARLDRSAASPAFMATGAVLVAANDGARGRGYALQRDGRIAALPFGDVDASFASLSTAANGSLAFAGATEHDPSEIYVLRRGARALTAITATNAAFAARAMGTKRTFAWTSSDGVPLDAVVTEPVGFEPAKRYPLVLYIHGGPTGASTTAFDFLGVPELMAARGWIVLEPNYRGSNSLGARGIATSIGHPASIAGRDIMQALAIVQTRYHVDPTRIGVSGWSAGGWMTSWLITHDTRWRAAFDGAAVDSLLNVATLGDIDNYADILIGGHPRGDDIALRRALAESPQTYAARVKTPTLIVTDAGDQRVPTPTSYEFFHALRAAGAPVELLIYPVNGHFPQDPLHSEDVARRWVDWFAQHFAN